MGGVRNFPHHLTFPFFLTLCYLVAQCPGPIYPKLECGRAQVVLSVSIKQIHSRPYTLTSVLEQVVEATRSVMSSDQNASDAVEKVFRALGPQPQVSRWIAVDERVRDGSQAQNPPSTQMSISL